MQARIETLATKKLIGHCMSMSFADNKTVDLWRGFMPKRKEITNAVGTNLISMQIYPKGFWGNFNPNTTFEKWATVEVNSFDNIPPEMKNFTLEGGLYAVFFFKGDPRTAGPTFQYIFQTWLPNSIYVLDDRPHFEILGEKFKREDPDSEEDIWIPIKLKNELAKS